VAFLRRRQSAASRGAAELAAITAFWSWWQAEGAAQTSAAIIDHAPARMVPALSKRVEAIGAGLAWELGRTGESHLLVISAEGDPALRGTARRWRRMAPATPSNWEYSDSRPPIDDPFEVTLRINGTELDIATATAWAHVTGAAIDVTVHHPVFARMPEKERQPAAFLLLDAVLGEAAVETWIGTVEQSTEPPLDPVPLVGLRAVVRELTDRFTDADGQPAWALMEGTTPVGEPVMAAAQIPLRAATAPHLDTYVAVVVPFSDRTEQGLPAAGSLTSLRDLEDHLAGRLGASGRVVAHQTHGGVRTLHLYVDGSTPAVEQLRPAIAGWDQGRIELSSAFDPGWEHVQHLRG
jgi:hypothetical protein